MTHRFWLCALAILLAATITILGKAVPIEEKLVAIHVAQKLETYPSMLPIVQNQSLAAQAAIADLAKNDLMTMRIETAFLVYPNLAKELLPMYGANAQFQTIFEKYGEAVLPAIHYFVSRPISSIQWMSTAGHHYEKVKTWFAKTDDDSLQNMDTLSKLTPMQRGLRAINYIDKNQYDFIGQFVVNDTGEVSWILSERFFEGLSQFFGSGVRELERLYKQDEAIGASDIGWASVDVLVFVSAVKVLRLGKTVALSSKGAATSARSASFTARAISGGRLVLSSARYAKWPALIGASYLVLRHPSLITDFFAEVGKLIGVPALLMQVVGWFILLLPILWLIRTVVWFCAPFVKMAASTLGQTLITLSRAKPLA